MSAIRPVLLGRIADGKLADINSRLGHDFDGQWMNALAFGASAAHRYAISAKMAEPSLGRLRSSSVSGADDQEALWRVQHDIPRHASRDAILSLALQIIEPAPAAARK